MHPNRGKIESIDTDKGITLVDIETQEEVVAMDAEPQGRLNQEEVNVASKGVSAVSATELVSATEPTVFDDEDCKLFSRGIFILLAVGTPSTGSGKLYCQWELCSSSGNALWILFLTLNQFEILLVESEEDPASLQEIPRENLELQVRPQVASPSTCPPLLS
nr:hypothetical protein [Tanacetum cinerariifolium]